MLETVATLAGFTLPLPLPDGTIPDVSRVCPYTGAVFIGDAKQSEHPQNPTTLGRLERYMRWLSRRRPNAVPDFFCVCHPLHHRERWLPVLELLAETASVA